MQSCAHVRNYNLLGPTGGGIKPELSASHVCVSTAAIYIKRIGTISRIRSEWIRCRTQYMNIYVCWHILPCYIDQQFTYGTDWCIIGYVCEIEPPVTNFISPAPVKASEYPVVVVQVSG